MSSERTKIIAKVIVGKIDKPWKVGFIDTFKISTLDLEAKVSSHSIGVKVIEEEGPTR